MHKAGLNIVYTAWWLKTIMSKELKAYGLTHEQYNVLRILKGRHPDQICVREIARRMVEKNSNVPRIIDRLEIKKLVKRNTSQSDKRETLITVTPVGIHILEVSTEKIDRLFDSMIILEDKAAHDLNRLLEKVREKEI